MKPVFAVYFCVCVKKNIASRWGWCSEIFRLASVNMAGRVEGMQMDDITESEQAVSPLSCGKINNGGGGSKDGPFECGSWMVC